MAALTAGAIIRKQRRPILKKRVRRPVPCASSGAAAVAVAAAAVSMPPAPPASVASCLSSISSSSFEDDLSPMTVTVLRRGHRKSALALPAAALRLTVTSRAKDRAVQESVQRGSLLGSGFCEEMFVEVLVRTLEDMCGRSDNRLPPPSEEASVFYSTLKQPFGLGYYVTRLVKHMSCSRSVFVNAIIYLDRVKKADRKLMVCEMNVHRLLMTALTCSVKFMEDEVFCNTYYQKVGGIQSLKEFNRLERVFLSKLGWNLNVSREEFYKYEQIIMDHSAILSDCDSD